MSHLRLYSSERPVLALKSWSLILSTLCFLVAIVRAPVTASSVGGLRTDAPGQSVSLASVRSFQVALSSPLLPTTSVLPCPRLQTWNGSADVRGWLSLPAACSLQARWEAPGHRLGRLLHNKFTHHSRERAERLRHLSDMETSESGYFKPLFPPALALSAPGTLGRVHSVTLPRPGPSWWDELAQLLGRSSRPPNSEWRTKWHIQP